MSEDNMRVSSQLFQESTFNLLSFHYDGVGIHHIEKNGQIFWTRDNAALPTNIIFPNENITALRILKPVSETELLIWYNERIRKFKADGIEPPTVEDDIAEAKAHFMNKHVARDRVRKLRRSLAPAEWQKRGPRGPRKPVDKK